MNETDITQDFIVTARKWRPLQFSDVVGQEHISSTLKNAIKTNRVHHAFLFCGPRGVGKTTSARILARALNCLAPVDFEPCNKCSNCQSTLDGRSLDVIEIDGASNNSVDDIRKLRENVKYPPVSGKYKMYIIDEVHMLSTSAFNALLKTLEEPPPHLIFVFATTESHKVPATIISRCQRFDFRRMEIADITGQLSYIAGKEGITIDEASLISIAKKADGSMRDSQSIFDQVVAFCGKDIVYSRMAAALNLIDEEFFFRVSRSVVEKDMAEIFNITTDVISRGYDLMDTLQGLIEHFRNILAIRVTGNRKLVDTSSDFHEKYEEMAKIFSQADLMRILNHLSQAEQALKFSTQPRIKFELALTKLAAMDQSVEISELISELKALRSLPAIPVQMSDTKASYAASKPELQPTETVPLPTVPKTEPQPQPSQGGLSARGFANSENLRQGWNSFMDFCTQNEKGLTDLKKMQIEFLDGEIIIYITEPFLKGFFAKKKTFIAECLKEFYKIDIAVSLADAPLPSSQQKPVQNYIDKPLASVTKPEDKNELNNSPDNSFTSASSSLNDEYGGSMPERPNEPAAAINRPGEERHPVEKAIMGIFGAKEISNLE